MNLPGFNADASVYRPERQYQVGGTSIQVGDIVPAMIGGPRSCYVLCVAGCRRHGVDIGTCSLDCALECFQL